MLALKISNVPETKTTDVAAKIKVTMASSFTENVFGIEKFNDNKHVIEHL